METTLAVVSKADVKQHDHGPHTPAFLRSLSPATALRQERDQLQAALEERKLLWGFLSTMPGDQILQHRTRIADINRELAVLEKIEQAIELGYQPYAPPADWYVGLASQMLSRSERSLFRSITLAFNAPMPSSAITAWWKAQSTGLFTTFMVAAPDRSLFRELDLRPQPVRSLWAEPVLIGYVQREQTAEFRHTYDGSRVAPGIITQGLSGFLVAHWDLEKDLKFMNKSR